jgi:hypothetical protein
VDRLQPPRHADGAQGSPAWLWCGALCRPDRLDAANRKSAQGFGGAGVLELIEDDAGGTYRAVYTVSYSTAVYVLHVFQKKSKRGTQTSQRDIDLIRERLKRAREIHEMKLTENKP